VSDDTGTFATGSPSGQPDEPSSVKPEHPPSNDQPRRNHRLGMLVGAAVVVLVAAVAITGYLLTRPGKSTAPTAVLDGTFRLDFDGAKMTLNGAPNPGSNGTSWYVFRSSCGSTGCAATGTRLDDKNHQLAFTPAATTVMHFVDGRWQKVPVRDQNPEPACFPPAGNGPPLPGADTAVMTLSWQPQPDGTLRGLKTQTIVSNECGYEGTVWQTPMVATRIGDAPPGITVADPATVPASPPTSSPAPTVAGPALNGTYRLDYEFSRQTFNDGGPVSQPGADARHWWAFRSLCTSSGCVATGAQLSDTNQQQAAGVGRVLRFADGHWQDTPHLEGTTCFATNQTVTGRVSWSWDPQPDGTLHGVDNDTALANGCGDQGFVLHTPLVVTRVGDVPPGVVLADPALF
jgi:hypothetical protein